VNWPGIDTKEFPEAWARQCLAEAHLVRQFHYGDFYPLTDHSLSETVWLAYQLHRPDMNQGVVIAYRRKHSPYPQAIFKLSGVNPRTTYRVKDLNTGKSKSYTGKALAEGITVELENTPDSIILHYAPAKQ
jgi:alpha-galactosidase